MSKTLDQSRFLRRAAAALGDVIIGYNASSEKQEARYGQLHRSAAVVSSFDLDEILAARPDVDEAEVHALTADSRPVKLSEGGVRWTLSSRVRRQVLEELGEEGARDLLEEQSSRPDDTLQRTFEAYLRGTAPALEDQSLGELTATLRVLRWLGSIIEDAPEAERVRQRLAFLTFLKPFRELVGDNFQGRRYELGRLSDYVGVRRASSAGEWIWRGVREIFNFHEKPPMMAHGAGGMGKSTLLAKFILDHAVGEGAHKVPFVYVDFDRPAMSAAEPLTLLFEALRQLATQFHHASSSLLGLRASWEKSFVDELRKSRRGHESGATLLLRRGGVPRVSDRMRTRMLKEFTSVLNILGQEDRPLLFILDTIEEVQFRGRPHVEELWSFLEELQSRHSRLRVVLSGRVRISDGLGESRSEQEYVESRFRTESLELGGLDRRAAQRFLSEAGLPAREAKLIARHITHSRAGASPLSLRVAAEVWRKRWKEAEALDDGFWAHLNADCVQAQLIGRYLDHVHSEELQRLAYPGFVLRRVTPELILSVLAGPCGVEVDSLEQAGELLSALSEEIALVKSIYGERKELRPRTEVRRLVLGLMADLDPAKVEKIHAEAVRYYEGQSDRKEMLSESWIEARTEEIYHRVALRQDESLIRERWHPVLVDSLSGALLELDDDQRALLDILTGKAIPESLRKRLSQASWERDTERRALDLIGLEHYEDALESLAEREDRLPGSPLYNLEGRILARLGRWQELRVVMAGALASFGPDSSSAARVAALCLAAEADAQLGSYAAALRRLDEASQLAEAREEPVDRLKVAILRLGILVEGADEQSEVREAEAAVARLLHAAEDRQLKECPELVFRAAELLGPRDPDALIRALRFGVLNSLSSDAARRLGRALGRFDAGHSRNEGLEPGLVAARAGLAVEDSVTEVWKAFLRETPRLASTVLPRVFEEFEPGPQDEIWDEVVQAIRTAGDIGAKMPTGSLASFGKLASGGEIEEASPRMPWPPNFRTFSGGQFGRLVRSLSEAFTASELRRFLYFRLGRSLESLTLHGSLQEMSFGVVGAASREGWLEELIVAAREARPQHADLYLLASELGLGTAEASGRGLEQVVRERSGFLDPARWRSRLGVLEGQVCRVSVGAAQGTLIAGTGFLVSPELLLTTYHTFEPVIAGEAPPESVTFRFDYRRATDGRELHHGTTFRLASADWLVDSQDRLDFVLVRLDGYPGDEPVGGGGTESGAPRRGWIEMPAGDAGLETGASLFVLHHENAGLLAFSMHNDGLIRIASDGSRAWYRVPTAPGSGGAPVFDANLELFAMHLGASQAEGFGVPVATIAQRIEQGGHLSGIGRDLV